MPSSIYYYVAHKHDDVDLVKSLLILLGAQVMQPSEY